MADDARPRTGREIAVVGLAVRLPGVSTPRALWDVLEGGRETLRDLTDDDLRRAGVPRERWRDPRFVRRGAVLEEVEVFDAERFGYSPRDAERMDPQTRLLHEVAWEALEDAGAESAGVTGAPVGVFLGSSANLAWEVGCALETDDDPASLFDAEKLWDRDFAPTRISHALGLVGPSLSVASACSSSLLAVHQACLSLLGGECRLALAGGASVEIPHGAGYLYQEGMVASPDGRCRPFAADAAGTVRGNGAAIVALELLDDALERGDPVRAVILGSAVNNDGRRRVGFTAPSVEGQSQVIRAAIAVAGVDPGSISFVEAHGTGTPLGDPIEVEGIRRALGARGARCVIGSIKGNVGHLDAAAGVVGLVKAVLALEARRIPGTLHAARPSPALGLAGDPRFLVTAEASDWDGAAEPRRAGVSSFGIGGTNVHVVLEEAPAGDVASSARARGGTWSRATARFDRRRYWKVGDAIARRPFLSLAKGSARPAPDEPFEASRVVWRREARRPPIEPEELATGEPWLILASPGEPRAAAISRRLRAAGEVVTIASPGRGAVRWADDGEVALEPGRGSAWSELVEALASRGRLPARVLCCWGLGEGDGPELCRVLERAVFAPLLAARALHDARGDRRFTVVTVTAGAQDVLGGDLASPLWALSLGPAMVLPQELAGLEVRTVDLDALSRAEEAAEALLAEILSGGGERLVALRGGRRWVRGFERISSRRASPPVAGELDGTVLVVGGLGRLGLAFTEALAARGARRVVATTRRSWPPEGRGSMADAALRRISAARRAGRQVDVVRCPTPGALSEMIASLLDRERLVGVVHAGGGHLRRFVRDIEGSEEQLEELEALVRSKLDWLDALAGALGDAETSFRIVTSSLASVLGGVGAAGYSATHAAVDAWVAARNGSGRGRWTVVDWDAWRSGGGATGLPSFDDATGREAFERVLELAPREERVLVAAAPLRERYRRWIESPAAAEERLDIDPVGADSTAPAGTRRLDGPLEEPGTATERRVAAVWARFLGLDAVGLDDDFFELGGDSLGAIALLAALERRLGVAIPTEALLEEPTVRAAARLIDAAGGAGEPSSAVEGATPAPAAARVVFNRGRGSTIFAFPPYLCFALAYADLAARLVEYEIVAFDAIEDCLDVGLWADAIEAHRPEGPLKLFGYSAGGRVAWAVTRELERRGRRVSDLLLLEAFSDWKPLEAFDEARERRRATRLLDEHASLLLGDDLVRERAIARLLAYSRLVHEIRVDAAVDADITLIHSEGQPPDDENADWVEYLLGNSWERWTRGRYLERQGSGEHMDMLTGEHLEANATLLAEVLRIAHRGTR